MPVLEPGPGSPFHKILVMGLRPNKPPLFQEALARLGDLGVSAQLMDAKGVAGLEHLETAARLAAASFASGRNLARSPATELLLYASARRQIKEAIQRLGVNSDSRSWALVSVSDSVQAMKKSSDLIASYGTVDDGVIEVAPPKKAHLMKLFNISRGELSLAMTVHHDGDTALKALVVERVALSELYR